MFQLGLVDHQTRMITSFAAVAQSVERVLGKDEVTGSIPVSSLTFYPLRLPKFICVAVKIAVKLESGASVNP